MREVIATILQVSVDDISIKATTTEKMGFAGREEGLVAYATVLLKQG
jgi:2-C-methyl-D-erythritol 2,4-cyclodiphosphate synthase (EC 4.6.1.12)